MSQLDLFGTQPKAWAMLPLHEISSTSYTLEQLIAEGGVVRPHGYLWIDTAILNRLACEAAERRTRHDPA